MVLALSVVRHAEELFADPVTTPIAGRQCTIGRGQECDIVLEDPTRHVSRKHATIVRQGDSYFLTVESRINPVILNGQAISAGQQAAVNSGDRLVIGEYEFSIVNAPEAGSPAMPDPLAGLGKSGGPVDLDALFGPGPGRPAEPAQSASPGLDALFGTPDERARDPLLDLLGGGSETPASAPAPEPHTEDPLMRILGAEASPAAPAARSGADELLPGTGPSRSIDDLLGASLGDAPDPLGLAPEKRQARAGGALGGGIGGSLEIDHVHDVNLPMPGPRPAAPPAAPRPRSTDIPASKRAGAEPATEADPLAALLGADASSARPPARDPLGLFDNASADAGSPRAEHDPLPPSEELTGLSPYLAPQESPAAAAPPLPVAPAARPAAKPVPAATPAAAADAALPGTMQPAIRAFLEGAGMGSVAIADADAERFLRECGATVRAAVEGLMGMLLARAKVKEELRASDRTMVASQENNALKLIETVDEALGFVFDPASRTDAFLPPPRAVADACADLQAHEIALVAGMRAALIGAVKLFEPGLIEKKLEKAGGKSLLANRKALLWERFVAHYEETDKEAEDNFDRVFGAAFLRAYQEQVRRLRG